MLQISKIRSDKDIIAQALQKRGWDNEKLTVLDDVISLDDDRKRVQSQNDELLAQRNQLSKEIGQLFKSGKNEEANQAKSNVEALKGSIADNESKMASIKDKIEEILLSIPNAPNTLVPNGLSEEDNEITKDWSGPLPELPASAIPHWEIGKKYDILDFELGVKLTGAGFPVFRKKGSRLQRALINFFLEEANEQGYEEIVPPLLVNEDSAN
jgi:seryl-tRNA synthetase